MNIKFVADKDISNSVDKDRDWKICYLKFTYLTELFIILFIDCLLIQIYFYCQFIQFLCYFKCFYVLFKNKTLKIVIYYLNLIIQLRTYIEIMNIKTSY